MTTTRLSQLERLLTLDPTDAFVLYGLAQEYAKSGDIARATDHYDRCIAADPHYTYAYYHKARVLADAGRTPEAIAALNAGTVVARSINDAKALGELTALLDQLE